MSDGSTPQNEAHRAKFFQHGWEALAAGLRCTGIAAILPTTLWLVGKCPFAQTANMPWKWFFVIGLGASLFGQTATMRYFTLKRYHTVIDFDSSSFLILSIVLVASAMSSLDCAECHLIFVTMYCWVLVTLDRKIYNKVMSALTTARNGNSTLDSQSKICFLNVYKNNINDIFMSVDFPVAIVISIWFMLYCLYHELNVFGGPMRIYSEMLENSKNMEEIFYFEDGIMAGVIGFQMLFVCIAIILLLRKWEKDQSEIGVQAVQTPPSQENKGVNRKGKSE